MLDGQEALLVMTGLAGGMLGGLLGLGGGIVLMPVLRFVIGLSAPQAAGTCILGVFCTTLAGSLRHHRLGHVHLGSLWPVIVSGAGATVCFSLLFAVLARRGPWIDAGMGLMFLLVAARMLRDGWAAPRQRPEQKMIGGRVGGSIGKKAGIGLAAGALPGLFGIGTGAILVPAFHWFLRAPIRVATGSSLACFAINALISTGFKWSQGYVDLAVATPICVGTLMGSTLGAQLNRRFPPARIKLAFGILFAFVAMRFFASTWSLPS